jgi:hypothetical protein
MVALCSRLAAPGLGTRSTTVQQGFDQNFALLVSAVTTGQQIQFWVNGSTVCGKAQVNWVEFGVEH